MKFWTEFRFNRIWVLTTCLVSTWGNLLAPIHSTSSPNRRITSFWASSTSPHRDRTYCNVPPSPDWFACSNLFQLHLAQIFSTGEYIGSIHSCVIVVQSSSFRHTVLAIFDFLLFLSRGVLRASNPGPNPRLNRNRNTWYGKNWPSCLKVCSFSRLHLYHN